MSKKAPADLGIGFLITVAVSVMTFFAGCDSGKGVGARNESNRIKSAYCEQAGAKRVGDYCISGERATPLPEWLERN